MKIYTCEYCFKQYTNKDEMVKCKESHYLNLVFVPILKEDLSILAHYLMTGGNSDMTERAAKTILRYFRREGKKTNEN